MITLAFYKGEGDWFDKLIQWWTCGSYSHVELVLGDDSSWPRSRTAEPAATSPESAPVGEVTILSSSPRDGGVREKQLTLKPEHWDLIEIEGDELCQRYDWLGIIFS